VCTGAEIDAVQIQFEDFILRIFGLEPEGENEFVELARNRPFVGEKEILGELLCQRRAALTNRHGAEIDEERAREPARADAEMRAEAEVLDRDESLRQIWRYQTDGNRLAAHFTARGDGLSVDANNGDGRRALRYDKRLQRRQAHGVDDEKR